MGLTDVISIAVYLTVLVTHCSCHWKYAQPDPMSPPGLCVLPQRPQFGNYTSPLCQYDSYAECDGQPGSYVPYYWVLSFKCNKGYSLEDRQDSALVFCANSKWYPKIPTCQTTCGKKDPCPTTTEYPWHVGLFHVISSQWTQYCLGTIISPHIVLTAADCVYDDTLRRVKNASHVKVAIGRRHVEWNHDEPDSVKSDVREIAVPPHYFGEVTKFAHNIALLNLDKSVNVSSHIMPACFELNHAIRISAGAEGTVTGWNFTDTGRATNTVSDSHLTYIDYEQCVFEMPNGHKSLVLPDKLCAKHRDGALLTERYRGAGLTFVNNGAHYVLGVVSSIVREKTDLTVFTDVTNCQLRNWINETIQRFNENHFKNSK